MRKGSISFTRKVIEQHPEYVEDDLLTRMAEPDRLITFRVAWVDDAGKLKSTEVTAYNSIQVSAHTKADYAFTRV